MRAFGCARLTRRSALCALLGGLAACGFEPLYGGTTERPGAVSAALAGIAVDRIADRRGQMLRNALEERLTPGGVPASPSHTLAVRLEESIEKLVFRRDASPTRANMTLVADFQLRAAGSDKPATSGKARIVIGYNISASDFGTLVAEEDARERAIREIANEISGRLAGHFAQAAARP